jgi:hypothetical protein
MQHGIDEAESDSIAASMPLTQTTASAGAARISHFDEGGFLEMVRCSCSEEPCRHRTRASEQARARTLLEAVTRSTTNRTLDLSALQRRLPADTAILSFVTCLTR